MAPPWLVRQASASRCAAETSEMMPRALFSCLSRASFWCIVPVRSCPKSVLRIGFHALFLRDQSDTAPRNTRPNPKMTRRMSAAPHDSVVIVAMSLQNHLGDVASRPSSHDSIPCCIFYKRIPQIYPRTRGRRTVASNLGAMMLIVALGQRLLVTRFTTWHCYVVTNANEIGESPGVAI
jgi:hypothetical protein